MPRSRGNNPELLENRTPRIFVAGITGAPGDGDDALASNLARDLPTPDLELVTDATRADFTVTGTVTATPQPGGQDLVELDWAVFDSNHRKIGQVTQLHPLAPGDMVALLGRRGGGGGNGSGGGNPDRGAEGSAA